MATQQRPLPVAFSLGLVCFIVAVVLFVLAAFTDVWTDSNLIALGLAFFAVAHPIP